MEKELETALKNNIWLNHKIGDEYKMDGKSDKWKIAYYPIFEDIKGNEYEEPRALIEKPILGKLDMQIGIDFREVPLRYLSKYTLKHKVEAEYLMYKCVNCGSTCLQKERPNNLVCGGCFKPNWKLLKFQEAYTSTGKSYIHEKGEI